MLFPITYRVNPAGHMEVGGCDLVDLAAEHGTPLYVYDEDTVRQRSAEFFSAMGDAGQVLYSAKAFAALQFLRVVAEEGLGLDVVSAGELNLALRSGFPADRIHFLGNNKSRPRSSRRLRCRLPRSSSTGLTSSSCSERVVPEGKRTPVDAAHLARRQAGHARPHLDRPARLQVRLLDRVRAGPGGGRSRRWHIRGSSWSACTRTSAPRSSTSAATSPRWR